MAQSKAIAHTGQRLLTSTKIQQEESSTLNTERFNLDYEGIYSPKHHPYVNQSKEPNCLELLRTG